MILTLYTKLYYKNLQKKIVILDKSYSPKKNNISKSNYFIFFNFLFLCKNIEEKEYYDLLLKDS